MLKIDVLLPDNSLYGVLHHFTRKLYEALERAGFFCRLLEGHSRYLIPLESPPDFTICFNGALQIDDQRFYCDMIRIPHVACLVDPPFRFFKLKKSGYLAVTCDDRDCSTYLHSSNFSPSFFMPHAVEKEALETPDLERIYDVVMLSTFVDCETRRTEWKKKFPKKIWLSMEEAAAIILGDEKTSLMDALDQTFHLNLNPHEPLVKIDRFSALEIFSEVELYIKGRDKIDLIEALHDVPIHLFGSSIDALSWQKYFTKHINVTVHPPLTFVEALKVMKQSKIILNSCIKNKNGAHERIFYGAASGAIVVTNDNAYLRENFIHEKEIILYKRSAFNEVNTHVKKLLANENQRLIMADGGKQKVAAFHTWDHRVASLIPQISPIIETMHQKNRKSG